MKFQSDKIQLEHSLAKIEAIVPAKDTQTLLSNVMLSISDEKVSITASDMESTVRISLPATNTENGELIVPARKITEIAKQLKASKVDFIAKVTESEGEESYEVRITGDQTGSAKFKLSGGNRSHFPELNHVADEKLANISSAILKEMIQKTFHSISQEDNRYIYNGLSFLAQGNRLTIVGTDGRRLSAISRDLPEPLSFPENENIVVHAKAIGELNRILDTGDEVAIGVEQRDVFFRVGDAELSSRLLEGKFPDYEKVIPNQMSIQFEMNREEIIQSLKQVMVMTETPSYQVRLAMENENISMKANTPDLGEAEIQLPIKHTGEPLEIAFNATYLHDILKSLDTPMVKLGFIDPSKPIVVQDTSDPDFIALVMPMKL